VDFTANKVVDPEGYGLRYTDEMHAGDDRTANSESNEMLEKVHQHHTLATISRNVLDGAGIWADVFNADDELHKERNPGWLTIAGNTIAITERQQGLLGTQFFGPFYQPNTAIWVWQSKEAYVDIRGNTMTFQKAQSSDPLQPVNDLTGQWFGRDLTAVAIHIEDGRSGQYTIADNKATGFDVGAKGSFLDEDVQWAVYGNDFGSAADPLYYDESVANEPLDEPLPAYPSPYDDTPPAEPAKARGEHEHP
jgi:hypothetical protein